MKQLFGDNISGLLLEQLQSDEESTDSEVGEVEKGSLKVIVPSWRSERVNAYNIYILFIYNANNSLSLGR